MTGQTKLAHWSPPQCHDHWSVTLNTQELHRRLWWGVILSSFVSFKHLQIPLPIFGFHFCRSHNTDWEYSQSISVYAPDMTPGNGHRTQNRASLCHSPGGWDYTSTDGAWLGQSREESGRLKQKDANIYTTESLQQKCWPWIANQTRDCFGWSYY